MRAGVENLDEASFFLVRVQELASKSDLKDQVTGLTVGRGLQIEEMGFLGGDGSQWEGV